MPMGAAFGAKRYCKAVVKMPASYVLFCPVARCGRGVFGAAVRTVEVRMPGTGKVLFGESERQPVHSVLGTRGTRGVCIDRYSPLHCNLKRSSWNATLHRDLPWELPNAADS